MLDHLLKIQGGFKEHLLKNVVTFKQDTEQFYTEYAGVGKTISPIMHNYSNNYNNNDDDKNNKIIIIFLHRMDQQLLV